MDTDEAISVFGISKGSIRSWQARIEAGGFAALRSGQTKLSSSQEQALVETLVDYDPKTIDVERQQ